MKNTTGMQAAANFSSGTGIRWDGATNYTTGCVSMATIRGEVIIRVVIMKREEPGGYRETVSYLII